MSRARVTERTFYEALIEVIRKSGGEGVQEISYNAEPDIQFKLRNRSWILSVKIGDDSRTIKNAFLQYLRHKEESGIPFGMLLLLPESMRGVQANEAAVRSAIQNTPLTALIDADLVKEELRNYTFPMVIEFIIREILVRLARRQASYYPLNRVIALLQQHVTDLMQEIKLSEEKILGIITDRKLFMDIGHLGKEETEAVAHFLASYIFLSQIFFLRLLSTAKPDFISIISPISHSKLRRAFSKILEINYRPIYEFDVLDSINEEFLKDTFDLIWGLQIERVRYELPGRIFHELMPHHIRKMLAAFYTRPQAAEILANLSINHSQDKVFDVACGSGTILTAAYRRKLELFKKERFRGDPHKRFCEEEIIGADIMPFAVHLTSANLAAMNPAVTIEKTLVMQKDSLLLEPKETYRVGMNFTMFPQTAPIRTTKGDVQDIFLKTVDTILMNPPFTKVERGIRKFVNMERFSKDCGGEVGLWGHFIILADTFLKESGTFGAVIPINILRGRESKHVRRVLFEEWTPLYILKPTKNYGFSEWSEYRDVLFIAQKRPPTPESQVKFCLVKKDLTRITEDDIKNITCKVTTETKTREDDLIDVETYRLSEVMDRFDNMMWFCGVTDFSHRDVLINFINKFSEKLHRFPSSYFREGYRPVPEGVSKFLFFTRHSHDARVEQAFLRFSTERPSFITAQSPLGASYQIGREHLTPTVRTPVGIASMDITNSWDYIAHIPYHELGRVCRSAGQVKPEEKFWSRVQAELKATETNIVVSRRINPFSPSTYLNAFYSSTPLSPSNQVNVILERDQERAKAICVLLNSVIFFTQFFLLKEESTGRYIDIRFYDLEQMNLYPPENLVKALVKVFNKFHLSRFPSLRKQFDMNFEQRYDEFWELERGSRQQRLWSILEQPIMPSKARLDFDLAVCKVLNIPTSKHDLTEIYNVFVNEMIAIKGLKRD